MGTGALAGAIGVAAVGASGVRLRARAHESAPRSTGAGGPVPVAAFLALVIELADDHGPDRVPGGTPGVMAVDDHWTSGIPGGRRGPRVVASTRRIDGRCTDYTPGGMRGQTVIHTSSRETD